MANNRTYQVTFAMTGFDQNDSPFYSFNGDLCVHANDILDAITIAKNKLEETGGKTAKIEINQCEEIYIDDDRNRRRIGF